MVLASVFLAHLHYTIDVIGAYAVTLSLFVFREVDLGPALNARGGGAGPSRADR